VIDIAGVTLKSEKLEQFAKYLAHQSLSSDRFLLLESLVPAGAFNHNNVSKSTQDSERIDYEGITKLMD
jgi:hypothetical protein